MGTELHWINRPWPGKLALAARPRSGDGLEDEIAHWHHSGVDTVLSLLSPDEEQTLGLNDEADAETELAAALETVNTKLAAGKNVLLHCRQGIGRAGLVEACLLVRKGLDPSAAVEIVSAARGVPIPEARKQRQWIDHYAAISTSAT